MKAIMWLMFLGTTKVTADLKYHADFVSLELSDTQGAILCAVVFMLKHASWCMVYLFVIRLVRPECSGFFNFFYWNKNCVVTVELQDKLRFMHRLCVCLVGTACVPHFGTSDNESCGKCRWDESCNQMKKHLLFNCKSKRVILLRKSTLNSTCVPWMCSGYVG